MSEIAKHLMGGGAFDAEEHPRDGHGQFASIGAGAGPGPEGKHVKKASEFVNGWKKNVFHPSAVAFRGAAAAAFGLPVDQDVKRLTAAHKAYDHKQIHINEPSSSTKKSSEFIQKNLAKGQAHKEVVEEIARVSQAAHAAEGDHVALYRGITGPQAREIMAAKAAGKPVNIKIDTMASFTDDHGVAKQFAEHGSQGVRKNDGVVIKVMVPRNSIIASHKAFPTLAKEREVLVASLGGFSVNHEDIE